ncbi:MAG: hypothetical protein E4G93_05685 [Dehalococcoidia bacterium]|nr:MAG: hypothetical protein E4G93_05685 [Dehalococcoidia bacterium]
MRKSGLVTFLLAIVLIIGLCPLLLLPAAVSADDSSSTEMRPDAVRVSSKYPSVTGPADTTFMFQVDILYQLTDTTYESTIADTGRLQSRVFNFELSGPLGWEVFVAESAWKLDKRMSSMQLRALGMPQSMVIVASAPWWTSLAPGEYPIEFTVTSDEIGDPGTAMVIGDEISDSVTLKAVISAWYGIESTTIDDRLNTTTNAGSPASVDVKVTNTGSATLDKVSISSSKPAGIANEQWVVRFEPESIKDLAPGEEQQLRVDITPPENAISGDYYVTLTLAGEPALSDFNPSLELRVSVTTRPTWVAIGVAVVVLAFGALVYAFYTLRQR